jgi:hypothetical protein
MLSTMGVLIVLAAALFIYRERASRRSNQVSLGRMSPQWIAEQRASKQS